MTLTWDWLRHRRWEWRGFVINDSDLSTKTDTSHKRSEDNQIVIDIETIQNGGLILYLKTAQNKNEFKLYFCIFNNRCVRYSRGSQDEDQTGLISVHFHIWYPWKAKPFKMRPNKKIRQNQKMKIQNTFNRFKIQFSDRKYFPKSGKRIHKHSNNASRVCNRLRLLTQNQVGFSK